MFPLAQAPSLRHKAIPHSPSNHPNPPSGCRKQSQEMGMHCNTLSATLLLRYLRYLFWWVLFFLFLFFQGNPLFPQKKVSCRMLRVQGGLAAPSLCCSMPPAHMDTLRPNLPSTPKQKLTRGFQLVNLTFGTLPAVCSAGGELRSLPPEEERVGKGKVSEAIDYEPRTHIRETSGLH